jgi:hypothetical protein
MQNIPATKDNEITLSHQEFIETVAVSNRQGISQMKTQTILKLG